MQRLQIYGALGAGLLVLSLFPTVADATPLAHPRVIGGEPASVDQFGFVGAVLDAPLYRRSNGYRSQYCGASLISPTTMITAAHCLFDPDTGERLSPRNVLIGFGNDLTSPTLRVIGVDRFSIHPGYRFKTSVNDIAVIYLAQPVKDFPTVALPSGADIAAYSAAGTPAKVAGWGRTHKKKNRYPQELQVGSVQIFPDSACGRGKDYTINGVLFDGFTKREAVPGQVICAAGATPAGTIVDACQGDSGGPLTVGSGEARRLMGVVSWGIECASRAPGVYSEIASAIDFLIDAGALPARAPILAPEISAERIDEGVSLRVTAPIDGTGVTAFAVTATDTRSGQTYSCTSASQPRKRTGRCVIQGIPPGTPLRIEAISGNSVGSSPVSAPVLINV